MCRHIQLLSQQPHEQIQVNEATTGHSTRGNHPTIQPQKIITQRFCIYGHPKRHVWATPGRKFANDKLKLHMYKFGYKTAPIIPVYVLTRPL